MVERLTKDDVGKIVSFGLERKLTFFERIFGFSRAYGRVLDVKEGCFTFEFHPLYPITSNDITTIRLIDYSRINDLELYE